MVKKSVFIFVSIFMLLSVLVTAESFNVTHQVIDNTVTFEQVAKFRITITNTLRTDQKFRLKTLDYPTWDIKTDPLINPIIVNLKGGESKTIDLFVDPLHITTLGVYDVTLMVTSETEKESQKLPLRVNIVSPVAGQYIPTVLATLTMDEKIDPTEPIPIIIKLDNQNPLSYDNLIIKIESSIIQDVVEETLDKKAKKTIELTKTISPQTEPKADTIVVSIISGGITLDTKVKRIEVIEIKEVSKEETEEKKFLKKTNYLKYTNVGNVQYDGKVGIETSFFANLFRSSKPKGEFIKEEDKSLLIWSVDIAPGSSITIEITENYRALLFIVILLLIVAAVYYSLRSPLTIIKSAANIATKEGGVSELKVVLHVTNRGKKGLKNIEIIDRIPNIIEVEKGLSIGTLHPSKVLKHEKKGTIIKWHIDELEQGDERVISYKIKSHLSILGEFTLKAAVGKFKYMGRETITHSNSLNVSP